jgi:hypothetical protein
MLSGWRSSSMPLLRVLALSSCAWLACSEGTGEEAMEESPSALEAWDAFDPEEELGDGSGRYRRRRRAAARAPDVEQTEIEQLAAIGYLEGTKTAHTREGVMRHDPQRSAGGVNLYVSAHAPEALLMDMEGRILHRWVRPSADIWPGPKQKRKGARYFRRAYLLEDGALLVIFEGLGIAKLDADSNVLWASPPEGVDGPTAHHDVEVQPNGDLLTLTRLPRIIPWLNRRKHMLDDFVTIYGPDGEKKLQISLAEAFGRGAYRDVLLRNRRKKGDIFHTNSIHMLDGSVAHVNTDFDPGNVLISIRHLNMLAVLDPKKAEIVWASRGPYQLQHDAEVLANGHILLFDNGPKNRQDSRALELDPKTLEPRWQYRGTAQDPLWSRTCGTVQRLPGGNTLVVESDNGRSIEVTPDGEIVWEWLSPHRSGNDQDLVATLFDLTRLPPETWPFGN